MLTSIVHSCFLKSLSVSSVAQHFHNFPQKRHKCSATPFSHLLRTHVRLCCFPHTRSFAFHSQPLLKDAQGSVNCLHCALPNHSSTEHLCCVQFIITYGSRGNSVWFSSIWASRWISSLTLSHFCVTGAPSYFTRGNLGAEKLVCPRSYR